MKVQVYTGLGTGGKLVWKGNLEILPRIGEDVVVDKAGKCGYTVEYIHHWLAGKSIDIYVRS